MEENEKLRIGTRGSPLALKQTGQMIDLLKKKNPVLQRPGSIEMIVIKTTGDRVQSQLLSEIGVKGLFTKEIDEAMLREDIDLAIHSMKDMPTFLPDGISLHVLQDRLDSRDAFIAEKASEISDLPSGATVGTSSLRRKAQLLHLRPDLTITPMRGNIDTRLKKLGDGEVDAILLAYAGLKRLGREDVVKSLVNIDQMLPAVGQGFLAATCRENDLRANTFIEVLSSPTAVAVMLAERAMLAALDGSCHTPIAGQADFTEDGKLVLRGMMLDPNGAEKAEVTLTGEKDNAESLGIRVAEKLILEAGPNMLESIREETPVLIKPTIGLNVTKDADSDRTEYD